MLRPFLIVLLYASTGFSQQDPFKLDNIEVRQAKLWHQYFGVESDLRNEGLGDEQAPNGQWRFGQAPSGLVGVQSAKAVLSKVQDLTPALRDLEQYKAVMQEIIDIKTSKAYEKHFNNDVDGETYSLDLLKGEMALTNVAIEIFKVGVH
jgi:hypothetical protein